MSKYRRNGRIHFSDDYKPSDARLREQILNRLSPINEERDDFMSPVPHLPKIPYSKLASDIVDKDDELNRLIDRYLNRAHYMADLLGGGPYNSHFCQCCWERNKENLHRNRSKVEQKPLNGYTVEDAANQRYHPGDSLMYVTLENAYHKAMTPRLPKVELELPSSAKKMQTPFSGRPEEMVYMFPPSGVDIDVDLQLKIEENRLENSKTPDSILKANSRYEASMRHLQDTIRYL